MPERSRRRHAHHRSELRPPRLPGARARAAHAPVALFVHGFLVDSTLWDPVAERLAAAGVRCILPDWPLGSHRTPTDPAAELSPAALGRAVPELLAALDLEGVTLVGNDTGGAVCQLALAGDTTRVGALVLTNCDVFERFPPPLFVPLFRLARHRWAVWTLMQQVRLRAVRHSALAYGMLLNRPRPAALTRAWVAPALADAAIRRTSPVSPGASGATSCWGPPPGWPGSTARPTWCGAPATAASRWNRPVDWPPSCPGPSWWRSDASTFVPVDRPEAVADAILLLASAAAAAPGRRGRGRSG